jgi:hypothetical protein
MQVHISIGENHRFELREALLAGSHQIAQCLGAGIRYPHRCQFARAMAARQLQSIPPIRLYPVPALTGTSVGATTVHSTPSSVNCQYRT